MSASITARAPTARHLVMRMGGIVSRPPPRATA
jgi:hypothetical protein